MKRKKLLVLSLTTLLALGTVCGCGDSSADASDDREYEERADRTEKKEKDGEEETEETDDREAADGEAADGEAEGGGNELLEDDDIYFFLTGDWMYMAGQEVRYFEEIGYELLGGDKQIPAGEIDGGGVALLGDNIPKFDITVYNPTDAAISRAESVIGGFKLRNESATDEVVRETEVYGGIRLGSSREDVEIAFGEPTSTLDNLYVYRSSDPEKYYKFSFDENGQVIRIEWKNCSADTLLQNRAEEETEKETDAGEENGEKQGSQDKTLLKPYLGSWEYENKDGRLAFDADFTWSERSGEKWSYAGTFTVDENGIYLYDKEDEFVMSIESVSMNNLMDDDGENLFRYIAN